MKNKLKMLAMATLLAGATVTASKAETLYQSLSVNLVLSYYQTAGTTDREGTITYTAANRKITTAEFLQLMSSNLDIKLNRGASLMRVTTLVEGTNYPTVITNLRTTNAGYTVLTNIEVPSTIVWANTSGNTNLPPFFTNSFTTTPPSASPPNTNYTIPAFVTNFVTYVIQGKPSKVIVGSSVQYYIINGGDLSNTNNWVPLNHTNNNAAVTISALDEAENFQNINIGYPLSIDDQNTIQPYLNDTNVYFGDQYNAPAYVNFSMAGLVTNLSQNAYGSGYGPIFVGSIKTNMAMTGTLNGDSINITMGFPDQPPGSNSFLANLTLTATNAIATATTAASVINKLPFTSWNATFNVYGSGYLYGYDAGTFDTNYVYMDASFAAGQVPQFLSEIAGFNEPGVGATTNANPPDVFTNSYTYVSGANTPVIRYVGDPDYYGFTPPFTINQFMKIDNTTPDFTGYSFYYTNITYTNVFTNVYTLVPADTYYDTNLSVANPETMNFTMSGTVKQTFVKVGKP